MIFRFNIILLCLPVYFDLCCTLTGVSIIGVLISIHNTIVIDIIDKTVMTDIKHKNHNKDSEMKFEDIIDDT